MESENQIRQYIKLLIKEYESVVLADDRYKTGDLDEDFVQSHFNVAVDKFLKTETEFEAKYVKETERIYYRGWISSHLSLMLSLERQEVYDKERDAQSKHLAKLEKEIERLTAKNENLHKKMTVMAEKAKAKRAKAS